MWIRSQNGEYLIKTNYFEIAECEDFDKSLVYDIDARVEDKWVTLGTYSTKEKALEILKEKKVHLLALKIASDRDSYNSMNRGLVYDYLTQEEYELLKEVLGYDR